MNRRKILRVGTGFLPLLYSLTPGRHHYEVIEGGLPTKTTIVNAHMDSNFTTLVLLLESDEFEEVPEGERYPEIEPKFRAIYLPEHSTSEASPN